MEVGGGAVSVREVVRSNKPSIVYCGFELFSTRGVTPRGVARSTAARLAKALTTKTSDRRWASSSRPSHHHFVVFKDQPCIDAIVVQANAATNDRRPLLKAHLQWPPENTPASNQLAKTTLDTYPQRRLFKIEIVVFARRYHAARADKRAVSKQIVRTRQLVRGKLLTKCRARPRKRVVRSGRARHVKPQNTTLGVTYRHQ